MIKKPRNHFSLSLIKEKVKQALIYLNSANSSAQAYDFQKRIKVENGITHIFTKAFSGNSDLSEFEMKTSAHQLIEILKKGSLSTGKRNFLAQVTNNSGIEDIPAFNADVNQSFNEKLWGSIGFDDIISAFEEKIATAEISFDEAAQVLVNLFDFILESKN